MLSATIPNYLDFAKQIGSIKKATIYIENTYKRVVPLEHKIYINSKNIFTILDTSKDNGKVNQEEVYNAFKILFDIKIDNVSFVYIMEYENQDLGLIEHCESFDNQLDYFFYSYEYDKFVNKRGKEIKINQFFL